MPTPFRWTFVCVLVATSAIAQSAERRELTTDRELASYALGVQVAFSIRQQAAEFDMDPAAVAMAIEDVLGTGELSYTPDQLQVAMNNYQGELQAKLSMEGEENLAQSVAFLEENRTKPGIEETDSGLQYEVLATGEGESPAPGATVTVHYRGTLIDGSEFDSSYARGEPATFKSDQVIAAWQEALPMMKPGDRWKLYVPPSLGYGERGSGGAIGPNQAMIFEVELLSIQ